MESFWSQQCGRRSRLHSKRSLCVVKSFLAHFSSLGSFLFLMKFQPGRSSANRSSAPDSTVPEVAPSSSPRKDHVGPVLRRYTKRCASCRLPWPEEYASQFQQRIVCCFAQEFWSSQVLIGLDLPPRSNEIRTSPLPARACSLFYSFSSFACFLLLLLHVFSYTCSLACSLGLWFSFSLALTPWLLVFMLLFPLALFSLLFFFETLLSLSSWIVLRAFFRSLPLVHEFFFVYRRVGGPATYPRRRLPIFESIRAACRPRRHRFFTNTCLVRILVKSLVAAVISQVFQRPSQCASIGSLSLVAPSAKLIKASSYAFCLLGACAGRCFLPPCVLLSRALLYRLNLSGHVYFFPGWKLCVRCVAIIENGTWRNEQTLLVGLRVSSQTT